MAFGVLAIAACGSADVPQCKPCAGDYLDPNGLIGPDDQVASIRVCIDGVCRTTHYNEVSRSQGWYPNVTGTHPPDPHRIESLEVTTFDARNKVIRVEAATSIELPKVEKIDKYSCGCSGLKIAYDDRAGRFAVTTQ